MFCDMVTRVVLPCSSLESYEVIVKYFGFFAMGLKEVGAMKLRKKLIRTIEIQVEQDEWVDIWIEIL